MSNELNIALTTGRNITARLIIDGAYVGTAITCTEAPTSSGHYSGSVPAGIGAGIYSVIFLEGSSIVGNGSLVWDGSAERTELALPTVAQMEARTLPAANYFDPATDTVATVTNITNLPAIPNNWITAAGLAPDAITEIQSGISGGGLAQETLDAISAILGHTSYIANAVEAGDIETDTSGLLTTTAYTNSLPTNFGSLNINSSGHIIVGGYASGQSPQNLVTGFATPANVTAAQNAIISHGDGNWATATGFLTSLGTNAPANWINAASIAPDAVNEIQSGLSTFDGDLSSITTAISNIPTNPLLSNDIRLNNLDATISSRSQFNHTLNQVIVATNNDKTNYQLADNAITSNKIQDGALSATKFATGAFNAVWSVATRTLTSISDSTGVTTLLSRVTDLLPTKAEFDNRTLPSNEYSTASNLDTVITRTGRVDALIENSGGDRFTAKALEASSSGSGGDDAATIYTYFTSLNREDVFKADVSNLSTFNATTDPVFVNSTPDSVGVSTLLSRITADRATYLDKLNVVGTIANTSNASTFRADLTPALTAISAIPTNPLLTNDTRVDAIKAKTDQLTFIGGDVVSTLNGEEVVISTAGVNAIVAGVNGALVIPTAVQIRTEIDTNSTQLAAIKTIATAAKNNATAGL